MGVWNRVDFLRRLVVGTEQNEIFKKKSAGPYEALRPFLGFWFVQFRVSQSFSATKHRVHFALRLSLYLFVVDVVRTVPKSWNFRGLADK